MKGSGKSRICSGQWQKSEPGCRPWLVVVDQTRQWAAQVTWPSTDFGGKSPCWWWWPVAGPVLGQVAFSDSLLTRLQTDPRLPACCHHQLIRKSTRFGPGGTKLCTKATKPDKNVWHFCYRLISSEPWLQLLIDKPRPAAAGSLGTVEEDKKRWWQLAGVDTLDTGLVGHISDLITITELRTGTRQQSGARPLL